MCIIHWQNSIFMIIHMSYQKKWKPLYSSLSLLNAVTVVLLLHGLISLTLVFVCYREHAWVAGFCGGTSSSSPRLEPLRCRIRDCLPSHTLTPLNRYALNIQQTIMSLWVVSLLYKWWINVSSVLLTMHDSFSITMEFAYLQCLKAMNTILFPHVMWWIFFKFTIYAIGNIIFPALNNKNCQCTVILPHLKWSCVYWLAKVNFTAKILCIKNPHNYKIFLV